NLPPQPARNPRSSVLSMQEKHPEETMTHCKLAQKLRSFVLIAMILQLLMYPNFGYANPGSTSLVKQNGGNKLPETSASIDDQADLAITVSNPDWALVRDVRNVPLPGGESQLKFLDVASSVTPTTVHFRSLDDPARLAVQEQNYEYDLLEPQKLLSK